MMMRKKYSDRRNSGYLSTDYYADYKIQWDCAELLSHPAKRERWGSKLNLGLRHSHGLRLEYLRCWTREIAASRVVESGRGEWRKGGKISRHAVDFALTA
jgi:hypothetical protein